MENAMFRSQTQPQTEEVEHAVPEIAVTITVPENFEIVLFTLLKNILYYLQ